MPIAITCKTGDLETAANKWLRQQHLIEQKRFFTNYFNLSYYEIKEKALVMASSPIEELLFHNVYYVEPTREGLFEFGMPRKYARSTQIQLPRPRKSVIPDEVEGFIKETGMSNDTLQLNSIVSRIREYLDKHGYNHTVSVSISADPEYPEWKEIKIHVKIDGVSINEIYDKLWKDLTKYAFVGIPDDVVRQILLKLDTNS